MPLPAQIAVPTAPSTASRAKTRASAQSKTAAAAASGTSSSTSHNIPDGTKAAAATRLDAGASLSPAAIVTEDQTPRSYGSQQPSPGSEQSGLDSENGQGELPESRERRLWELRLLHNNLTMGHPFNVPQTPELTQLFSIDVPNMALRDGWDVLLYGIMAHSALHMWTRATDPQERDHLVILQQTYKSMMLREQAREVVHLTSRNADALCFSSLRILAHALALVQTLPMDPWQPPVEWLRMGKGAGAVFKAAAEIIGSDPAGEDAKIMTFLKTPPVMVDPSTTIGSDHSALDWLLEHPGTTAHDRGVGAATATDDGGEDDDYATELDDPAVRRVYDEALGYTCSVARAIAAGEPEDAVGRRFGGFAVLVSNDFTRFLIERRPRAMVVLAHFMSLWLDYEHIWIIGKAGERQIRGIQKSLPLAWSSKLDGLFGKLKGGGAGGLPLRQPFVGRGPGM
ncbi:c6 zinc finger domain-containing protein [Apiospora marii]|uniref:C6 zinc finger domain-containing protein n=1 Tax=Apiospora marii TaxID=335849 RepID=A0ABR1R8H6_9PEZI